MNDEFRKRVEAAGLNLHTDNGDGVISGKGIRPVLVLYRDHVHQPGQNYTHRLIFAEEQGKHGSLEDALAYAISQIQETSTTLHTKEEIVKRAHEAGLVVTDDGMGKLHIHKGGNDGYMLKPAVGPEPLECGVYELKECTLNEAIKMIRDDYTIKELVRFTFIAAENKRNRIELAKKRLTELRICKVPIDVYVPVKPGHNRGPWATSVMRTLIAEDRQILAEAYLEQQ